MRSMGKLVLVGIIGALSVAGCDTPPPRPVTPDSLDNLVTLSPVRASAAPTSPGPTSLGISAQAIASPDDVVIPFLQRQADCSLTLLFADLQGHRRGGPTPNYQNVLLAMAGLGVPANPFPGGCTTTQRGAPAQQGLVLGQRSDGAFYGALAVSNGVLVSIGNTTTGLLSQNTITLTTSSSEFVGTLATGDFNGDGRPDLVVTSVNLAGGGAVTVLPGNGDGTFGTPVRYPQTFDVRAAIVDDFNGDNRPDLAITGSDGVYVMLGNGDGSFGAATSVGAGIAASGANLVAADFNGDGHRDLAAMQGVVVNGSTPSGQILLGRGDGRFDAGPAAPFDSPDGFNVGDFDGDGHVDLVLAISGVVQFWRGNGDGSFVRPTLSYALLPGARVLNPIDLDGDGRLDLVVGLASGGGIGPGDLARGTTQFLFGRGDGSFTGPLAYARASSLLADFNGDGRLDLLGFGDGNFSNPGARGLQPFFGNADGSFTRGPLTLTSFEPYPGVQRAYLAPDLNGDRRADFVSIEGGSNTLATLHTKLGNGDGSFAASGSDIALPYYLAGASGTRSPPFAAADFNGDGQPDLVGVGTTQPAFGNAANGELYVLDGNGTGGFAAPRTIDSALRDPLSLVTADFNGDGHADVAEIDQGLGLFTSSPQPGSIRVYLGTGSGSFAAPVILDSTLYPVALAVADVNVFRRLGRQS